ncbi:MAG: hypothetical protein JWN56_1899 [Sphingobacteriales bacterium]|nr:hypothetical protein [Sphingobacteriales bacterium]
MKITTILSCLLIASFLIAPNYSSAQNKVTALVSQNGDLNFKVEKPSFYMCISQSGGITGYSILKTGVFSYDFNGRIEKIGAVAVSYDYYGRIDKIDSERISYDFNGRVNEVGDTKISYDFNNKVDNIGGQKVSYGHNGKVDKISSATVSYNFVGKVEKIDDDQGVVYLDLINLN